MVGWLGGGGLLWFCMVGYIVACTGLTRGRNWVDFVESGFQSHRKGCFWNHGYLGGDQMEIWDVNWLMFFLWTRHG